MPATAVCAALALAAALPAPAAADVIVASQEFTSSSVTSVPLYAQTFSADFSGQLDRVKLGSVGTTGASLSVGIRTVSATTGQPTGVELTSTVTAATQWSCCAAFKDIPLPLIRIVKDQTYAIVVEPLSGKFTWKSAGTQDVYDRGHAWVAGSPWTRGSTLGSEDFAFEAWAIPDVAPTPTPSPTPTPTPTPPPNHAPALDVVTDPVSVGEGTTPSNTGTFSDPDGDPVSLLASSGTVVQSGPGTWSWSQPAANEGVDQTVTITARDNHGLATSKSFTLHTYAVAPVAAIITDPPLIPEGSFEKFTAEARVAFAGDAATTSLFWTVTKGGAWFAGGSGPAFSFAPDDDGAFVVTVKATDTVTGLWTTDSVTVNGQNVDPTAQITGVQAPSPLLVQRAVTFTGSFTDPGLADTETAYWTFGDGTGASQPAGTGGSGTFSIAHTYSAPGSYTVGLQVIDDDNGVGTAATRTVVVMSTQQAIATVAAKVNKLTGLNAGQKNSLLAKLNAASASAARGDNKACSNQLNAFVNELSADVKTGKVSEADAAALGSVVAAINNSIGTHNRFLEWLPAVF